ncbi:MAG: bifunctional precorrin-2 dehydrogenase/sirohydrochlorin ferrochelatase [Clostridia bacterium]|nr:bifunctional precorrin-2 dehydrogenase/sirohydrochlorin ferrochelatase [Clostridia bacterium]
MQYFPMYLDIKDKTVIVCGGGSEACAKARRIMPFGPIIRVISSNISGDIEGLGVFAEKRRFEEGDLDCCPVFVITAEDHDENRRIADICRARHIPVNAVDQPSECDFIFPSIIGRGDMCIAISTEGKSPSAAAALRERIEEVLPEGIEDILPWMEQLRAKLSSDGYDSDMRRKLLRVIVREAFAKERPLSEDELAHIIEV